MSAFQPFGATNAPDTCKWCGRRLRRRYKTTWAYHQAEQCGRCGSTNLRQSRVETQYDKTYVCRDCDHYGKGPRSIVERTLERERPGDYGDGHFCGLSCGYRFAVVMADGGRQLVAKGER